MAPLFGYGHIQLAICMINKNQLASSFQKFLKDPVVASNKASVRVTAKLSHSNDGSCPYCSKAMTRTNCCGQEVYICEDDRAVFPLPDSMLTNAEDSPVDYPAPIFPI